MRGAWLAVCRSKPFPFNRVQGLGSFARGFTGVYEEMEKEWNFLHRLGFDGLITNSPPSGNCTLPALLPESSIRG